MTDPAAVNAHEPPFPERFINSYVAGLREGHRFALDAREHLDRMLTWAIGLMGAAIFGSESFFRDYPPTARVIAVMPWLFGIVCAIAGRLVARELMEKDNLFFFHKVTRLEGAPLLYRDDEAALLREVHEAIGDKGQEQKRDALKKLAEWLRRCYYATHIFLGVTCSSPPVPPHRGCQGYKCPAWAHTRYERHPATILRRGACRR